MKQIVLGIAGMVVGACGPLVAAEPEAPVAAAAAKEPAATPVVPDDLVHIREELGVNEFTAPSIARLFDTLKFLMPIPLTDVERKVPEQMPSDRANLAIELGFLIADGFLVVQAGQMDKVEGLAKQLTKYGKSLGIGDRVNRHAAAMLESAKKDRIDELKTELAATQEDVEDELLKLRDADLAHLISLGGWIRALEVAAAAVDKQFSPERARKIMREDIADYYTESVAGLEPKVSERANFLEMRDILAGMRHEMVIGEGEEPTQEQIADIRKQAKKLADLSLQRRP